MQSLKNGLLYKDRDYLHLMNYFVHPKRWRLRYLLRFGKKYNGVTL